MQGMHLHYHPPVSAPANDSCSLPEEESASSPQVHLFIHFAHIYCCHILRCNAVKIMTICLTFDAVWPTVNHQWDGQYTGIALRGKKGLKYVLIFYVSSLGLFVNKNGESVIGCAMYWYVSCYCGPLIGSHSVVCCVTQYDVVVSVHSSSSSDCKERQFASDGSHIGVYTVFYTPRCIDNGIIRQVAECFNGNDGGSRFRRIVCARLFGEYIISHTL